MASESSAELSPGVLDAGHFFQRRRFDGEERLVELAEAVCGRRVVVVLVFGGAAEARPIVLDEAFEGLGTEETESSSHDERVGSDLHDVSNMKPSGASSLLHIASDHPLPYT